MPRERGVTARNSHRLQTTQMDSGHLQSSSQPQKHQPHLQPETKTLTTTNETVAINTAAASPTDTGARENRRARFQRCAGSSS
jgi:hypothetical protein